MVISGGCSASVDIETSLHKRGIAFSRESIDRKFGGSIGKKRVRYLRVFLCVQRGCTFEMCRAQQRECLRALPSAERLERSDHSL